MARWNWSGDVEIGGNGQLLSTGMGAPEGVITAAIGSLYLRLDGTSGSSLYVKEAGVGSSGWTAIGAGGATITLYTDGTPNSSQTSFDLVSGNGMTLTDQGAGAIKIDGPVFKVQGTATSQQKIADFRAGTGISISDIGSGRIQISSTVVGPAFQANSTPLSGFVNTFNLIDGVNTSVVDDGSGSVQLNVNAVAPGPATVSKTTGALNTLDSQGGVYNADDTESGSLALDKTGYLLKVVVDRAARVRLYRTAALRDADLTRPNTVSPTPGTEHGVCVDLYLDGITASLTWNLDPVIIFTNGDVSQTTSIYYNITNLSSGTHTIQATFTHVQAEG